MGASDRYSDYPRTLDQFDLVKSGDTVLAQHINKMSVALTATQREAAKKLLLTDIHEGIGPTGATVRRRVLTCATYKTISPIQVVTGVDEMTNGGFESATDWTFSGGATRKSGALHARTGTYGVELDRNGETATRSVSVHSGAKYRVSIWCRAPQGGKWRLQITAGKAAARYPSSGSWSEPKLGAWIEKVVDWTAPVGATTATFTVTSDAHQDDFSIDDITMVPYAAAAPGYVDVAVTIRDEVGNAIPGVWTDPRWAVYLEARTVKKALSSLPRTDGSLATGNIYASKQLTYTIVSYSADGTTATVRVRLENYVDQYNPTLPTDQDIVVYATAVSFADRLSNIDIPVSTYPGGGPNPSPGGPGDSGGESHIEIVDLTGQLLLNANFESAPHKLGNYQVAPSWDVRPGQWTIATSLAKNPAYCMAMNSWPSSQGQWLGYPWNTILPVNTSASPRKLTTSDNYLRDTRGASQTVRLRTKAGAYFTSAANQYATLEADWHLLLYEDWLPKSKVGAALAGYFHLYFFNTSGVLLGVDRKRRVVPFIPYTSSNNVVGRFAWQKYSEKVALPAGTACALVCIHSMWDWPGVSYPPAGIMAVDNVKLSVSEETVVAGTK